MRLGAIGHNSIKKRSMCAGLLFFKKFNSMDNALSGPTSCNKKQMTHCLLIPESDRWFCRKKWGFFFLPKKIFSTYLWPKTHIKHLWNLVKPTPELKQIQSKIQNQLEILYLYELIYVCLSVLKVNKETRNRNPFIIYNYLI